MLDLDSHKIDEDELFEPNIEDRSSRLHVERMMAAEDMLGRNGLLDTQTNTSIDVSDLPSVTDTEKTGHYWQSLLDQKKDQLKQARRGQASQAKAKKLEKERQNSTIDKVEVIDQSYFEKTFKAVNKEDRTFIDEIVAKFTLNEEQARAFKLVANHATLDKPPQLKMYLGGMAGTGKSQVIKALMEFFEKRDETYRFTCMAPTGSAASLIGGSTYHSMLGINPYREKMDKLAALSDVKANLQNVDYVFMDEVSMIDCLNLYNICRQMCKSLDNEADPFGGKNMIFAGDFAQLPPVSSGRALYSHTIDSVIHTDQSHIQQEASLGKAVWHQFTTVVILRQNMRQRSQTEGDAKFRTVLENLRYKSCTREDVELLKTRILGPASHKPKWTDDRFRNVSAITSFNASRDKLNERGAERFAKETTQSLAYFYSVDRHKTLDNDQKMSRQVRKRKIDPTRNTDRLGSRAQFHF